MNARMTKDRVSALLFLLFSATYDVMSLNIDNPFASEESAFTPQTLPLALATAGVILSLLTIAKKPAATESSSDISATFQDMEWKPVSLLVGLMVVYGACLPFLGFIISTIIFLIGGFLSLGERNWKIILSCSIILSVGFWFILTQLLGIYLATGDVFFMFEGS